MEEKNLRLFKVSIPKHLDGEGGWHQNKKHWSTKTLREASVNLEEFDIPLCAIDLDTSPWTMSNFLYILYHIKRIEDSDLNYPILQDPTGCIIDGWHRIAKAILNGDTTIKAKRLNVMPEYDSIDG